MLSKKKKIIILVGMVALLVATGVLNVYLNNSAKKVDSGIVTYGNFFDTYRADRIATREQTALYLDAIIANSSSSAEAVAEAEASKLQLAQSMDTELVLEGLIKALGYDDVVITASTENVNIILKAADLTETEVAEILKIVVSETNKKASNVRIIPIE